MVSGSRRLVGELCPESKLGEDTIEPELVGDKFSGLGRFAAASARSAWRLTPATEATLLIDVRIGSATYAVATAEFRGGI